MHCVCVWTNFEQAVTAETSTVLVNESVIHDGTPISLLSVVTCLTCLFVTMILSFVLSSGLSFGFKQIVAKQTPHCVSDPTSAEQSSKQIRFF